MKNSQRVLINRMMEKDICPRCEGLVPNHEQWGEYIGALSRLSRGGDSERYMVCSPCGQEEALEEYFNGCATPVDAWPIQTPEAEYRRSVAFDILSQFQDGDFEPPNS